MFTREQVLNKFFEMSTQSWRCRKKRGKEKKTHTHTHTQDVVYEKKKMIFQLHNIQYYFLVSKLSSLY